MSLVAAISTFFILDYFEMIKMRSEYKRAVTENESLKGEALVLMNNLDKVVGGLKKVEDYTSKLDKITSFTLSNVKKKTGIGPLSQKEYKLSLEDDTIKAAETTSMPLGVNLDQLFFRPVLDRIKGIQDVSSLQAREMQKILNELSQQKSLLNSIPSFAPVDGWIASGFGYRISPFTGDRGMHSGIDIASPIGTPILVPADGVVIFEGKKDGYGNFVMVAHGYGIVSRYGHNAENLVKIGQRVRRGEQIATVGMSGRTTGPHVHYEVVVNGKTLNPQKFILDFASQTRLAH